MKWEARTESGTLYRYADGILRVDSRRGGSVFKPIHMAVVPAEEIDSWSNTGNINWNYLMATPFAEIPEVGSHFYASGREEWRISTPIETVNVLED